MTPTYHPLQRRRASFPNLNFTEMRKVCSAKPAQLAKKYGLVEQNTRSGKAWFKDNGSKILAVAHLDSRQPFLHFEVARLKPDTLIYCPTLDDRLGAYIILDWLQSAGIKPDILLTENEEKGASTAGDFQFPRGKEYNWMFSFDRTGTDVVMYNYRDTITAAMLEKHGWKVGYGSYSCISDLEDLGCKGFNFGAGYHDYHSEYAFASRNEIIHNLRRFYSFYSEYANTEMPHEMRTSVFARDRNQGHLSLYKYDQGSEVDFGPTVKKEQKKIEKAEAAEHKSKVQKIKERLANDKEKTEKILTGLTEARRRAIAVLLLQDISLGGFSQDVLDMLYSNSICLFAELVSLSRVQFLNLSGATKEHADNIEANLKKYNLGFSTKVADYNVDMTIITNTVNNTIRKVIKNNYTEQIVQTTQEIEPTSGDRSKAGLKMIPIETKRIVTKHLQLPLSTKAEEPTEKSKPAENNNAEVIMISVERHKDDNYRLVSEGGKLKWRAKIEKVGFQPTSIK